MLPTVRPKIDGLRLREQPVNGNPVGQVYTQDILESLESPEATLKKLGCAGEWLKVRTAAGLVAYTAAEYLEAVNVPAPATTPSEATPSAQPTTSQPAATTAAAAPAVTYVRSKIDGLRLREKPVDGKPIGQTYPYDTLKSLETPDITKSKLGVSGQWLQVSTEGGLVAYVAAQYIEAAPAPQPINVVRSRNMMGMNLDHGHPLGTPDPSRLGGIGWVRFGYNVSNGTGSQDITAAYNRYRPLAERYAKAGMKVMFTFTHQTYGEGVNEFWPWPNMTDDKWRVLTGRFTEMVGRIVKQYAGQNLVHCWQIWNEQDAPIGAVASVPMSPKNYAYLLSETIKTIRAIDPSAAVITGGHTRGPADGSKYARDTIASMPAGIRPDGIAFHPYGRGTRPGDRYCNWGHIDDELKAYVPILPDRPVWITEWGALDKEGDSANALADYASSFVDYLNTNYKGKVASAIWYAWAMGMHNGYGLVGRDDKPLQPLYDKFLALRG